MKRNAEKKKRKPNWNIINRVRREKEEKRERSQYREIEPGVWIK